MNGPPARPARAEPSQADVPAAVLADAFARQAEGWARRAPGADASRVAVVRHAAHALSIATSDGHVCLTLDELARTPGPPRMEIDTLRTTLLASGIVGTPAQPAAAPLILDDEGRLFLHRYFDYERRLARRVMQAVRAAPTPIDGPSAALLNALFAPDPAARSGGVDWQQIAAALALRKRLVVISGGPGTGKTTTVVNLLACLVMQQPDCRIALAAPTGKAAARLTETIHQRARHLPLALRTALPAEATTVHRLLGARGDGRSFQHHAGYPLPIDALVVDEASMLDLALATHLLEAVPVGARIILLGDKDQLAAVQAGAVFAELSADPTLTPACLVSLEAACGLAPGVIVPPAGASSGVPPLRDTAIWFTQNFRFDADSGIGHLATAIRGARAAPAVAWLRQGGDASVQWFDDAAAIPGAHAEKALKDGYAPFLRAVREAVAAPAAPASRRHVFDAFDRFRALCAVREGPRGVLALNTLMSRHARAVLGPTDGHAEAWAWGRPVMVLRNDAVLRLFNGDIGIVLPDADGRPVVCFPDAADGVREVPPPRLPAHETAFAMTVHKAQGSEFDEVFVMLPAQRSRVVTRELLYTAVTRARQRVLLCAGADTLAGAIQTSTQRNSGLPARLREAAADTPPLDAPR